MKIEEYIAIDCRNHYREWLNSLSAIAAAKATVAVARMATGNTSGLKGMGQGLAEWRIDWGPGIRIYVHQASATSTILMGGSDKGDQRIAIDRARMLVKEYKQRKKQARKKRTVTWR